MIRVRRVSNLVVCAIKLDINVQQTRYRKHVDLVFRVQDRVQIQPSQPLQWVVGRETMTIKGLSVDKERKRSMFEAK